MKEDEDNKFELPEPVSMEARTGIDYVNTWEVIEEIEGI